LFKQSRQAQASNLRPIFWQHGIAVFAASFCYAKITPAALQRGEFNGRCGWHAEALGRKRKSGSSDFWRTTSGPVLPIAENALDGTKLSKACPMLKPF